MLRNIFFGHVALSILSAGSNYLFQVILARFLGQESFTNFSVVWAEINFLMFLGTWSYYGAAIFPLSEKRFKQIIYLCHLFSLSFVLLFYFTGGNYLLFAAIILGSVAQSMLSGRLIGEGNYFYSGVLNLFVALIKIILLFVFGELLKDHRVILGILYAAFFFTHAIFMSFFAQTLNAKVREISSLPHTLIGALILTFATHFFPSADVLWVSYFRTNEMMKEMAPLSLVTRGIFFAQIIWAQWWLPKVNDDKSYSPFFNKGILLFSVIILPFGCALAMRILLQFSLHWDYFPDLKLFYFSALSATFMALHFQRLQFVVLKMRSMQAFLMLALVVSSWSVIGIINSIELTHYFIICIIFHALSCLISFRIKT